MAINDYLPTNPAHLRVRYPVKRFQAAFDGFTGLYDFSAPAVAAFNTDQTLLKLEIGSIYLIERISFFAGAGTPDAESNWLTAMQSEANFPFFRLHFRNSVSTSIYPEPVRCVNFIDGLEQLVFFWTTAQGNSQTSPEELRISFGGLVGQVAGMVGIDPLLAEVNFTIYQVTDPAWVKDFIEGKFPGLRGLRRVNS